MESTTINETTESPPSTPPAAGAASQLASSKLRHLQRALLQAVNASSQTEMLLSEVGRLIADCLPTVMIQYFRRSEGGDLAAAWHLLPDGKSLSPRAQQQLLQTATAACQQGHLHIESFGKADEYVVISAPIFFRDQAPDALVLILPAKTPAAERVILVQLAASHITLWHILQESIAASSAAQSAAALMHLLAKLGTCEDLRHASATLVNELKEFLGCDSVAVGLRSGRAGTCRLVAISGTSRFCKNSELAGALEATMDESILRGTLAVWPPSATQDRHTALAQQTLASLAGKQVVASGPLELDNGQAVGGWVFLGDDRFRSRHAALHFIRTSEKPIAAALRMLQRAERGPVAGLARRLLESRRLWRRKLAAVVTSVLVMLLFVPTQFKIRCDCQIQPVVRRYVAAPYDGKLEKVLVATGDLVSHGDVLARMDGRDIRWELAGLIAQHGHVSKQRDVALASHETVTAQLAQLEMERLDLKIQMLEHRAENLEIRSPIDGIVISGDLEKAEGAPLRLGQSLFEIGPLDQMAVELAIPEDHVFFVRHGLHASIRLDAYPRRRWEAAIGRVHPRSEDRDNRNVFLAEVNLDNPDDLLRPGMNGQARIIVGYRPLVWNLFHRPWYVIVSALGW